MKDKKWRRNSPKHYRQENDGKEKEEHASISQPEEKKEPSERTYEEEDHKIALACELEELL